MAGEVVGTAYVRIRAITAALAKDVEDGVNAGMGDADVDAASKKLGERLGDGISEGINGGIDDVDIDSSGRGLGDRLSDGIGNGLRDGDGIGDGIGDAIGDIDFEGFGVVAANRLGDGIVDGSGGGDWGRRLGTKLGKLLSGLRIPVSALVAGLLAAIATQLAGPLVQLIGEYIFGLIAQVGFLSTALAGLGAAGAGAFALILGGVIPLVLAFTTASDHLNVLKKRAKEFAEEWKVVGEATVEQLVPGLVHALDILSHSGFVTYFAEIGASVGATAGNMARMSADVLRSSRNARPLETISWGIKLAWERLGHFVVFAIDAMLPIVAAIAPAATKLVESLAEGAEHLAAWAHWTSATGELADNVWLWYSRAAQVVEILSDLIAGVWNVFKVGADSATPGMDRFAWWAETFRQWTESDVGQNRLKQIFDDAMPVLHEFNGLVADIVRALFSPATNQSSDSIAGFIKRVRDEYLPDIIDMGKNLADDLEEPLNNLADAFGEFFEEFQKADGLEKTLDGITFALEAFAAALRIPYIGTALAQIIGFVTAFAILNSLTFGGLGAAVAYIAPIIGGFLGSIASAIGSGVVSAFTSAMTTLAGLSLGALAAVFAAVAIAIGAVVAGFMNADTIIERAQQLRDWFNNLNGAVKPIVAVFGALALVLASSIVPFVALGVAIAKWREIPGFIAGVARAIWEFITRLPQTLANGARALWQWIQDAIPQAAAAISTFAQTVATSIWNFVTGPLATAVASVGTMLWDWLQSLPGTIASGMSALGGALVDWVQESLPTLAGNLANWWGQFLVWVVSRPPIIALQMLLWGLQLVNWIVEAIPGLASNLWQFAQMIWDWIIDMYPRFAAMMWDFYTGVLEWIWNAVRDLPSQLWQFAQSVWDWITRMYPQFVTQMARFYTSILQWIWDAVRDLPSQLAAFGGMIWDFVSGLPGEILRAALGLADVLVDTGYEVITGFIDGLWSGLQEVFDAIADIGGQILDAAKDVFSINSPSRKMMVIGRGVMEGLDEGIRNGADPVTRTMTHSLEGMLSVARKTMDAGSKSLIDGSAQMFPQGAAAVVPTATSDSSDVLRDSGSQVSIVFEPGSINVTLGGDATDDEQREAGARVAEGIAETLGRRRISLSARTS